MIDAPSVLLAALFAAGGPSALTLASPDQAALAELRSPEPTSCESTVRVRDARGVLAEASYLSSDAEHGRCVAMAQWTQDSRFFVYLLVNAGGHQAWHTSIQVVSRATRRLIEIEEGPTDAVTAFDFRLFGAHSIEYETSPLPWGDFPPHKVRLDLQTLENPTAR